MHPLQKKYKLEILELVTTSNCLKQHKYVTSRGGNLSFRVADEIVLITPTNFAKDDIAFEDILVTNLEGEILYAAPKVGLTSETPLHLRILKKRPDVKGIIHAHPPILTGFAFAGLDILSRPIHPEVIMELGPILTADYAAPASEALAASFDEVIKRTNAVIMKNHGVMVCSPNGVWRAFELLEMAESIAFSAWVGLTSGKINNIPDAELDKIEKLMVSRNLPIPGVPGAVNRLRDLFSS